MEGGFGLRDGGAAWNQSAMSSSSSDWRWERIKRECREGRRRRPRSAEHSVASVVFLALFAVCAAFIGGLASGRSRERSDWDRIVSRLDDACYKAVLKSGDEVNEIYDGMDRVAPDRW